MYSIRMNVSKLSLMSATAFAIFAVVLAQSVLPKPEIILMRGAVGPESIAFDVKGEGPYTGVADGRILKWHKHIQTWVEFAVTSPFRVFCRRPSAPEVEHICGRPLGLRFDEKSGDLYIADAYFGLQVVGPNGGLTTTLVNQFDGKPLLFTNDLDIDDNDNVIYFTDTSTVYQRRQFVASMVTGDRTGRLFKYDRSTKEVALLLGGLAFSNGVALSKDRSFVLVTETSACRIVRYWLKGPLKGTHDTFAELPGYPDNVRINSNGEFWVALQAKITPLGRYMLVGNQPHATAIKLGEDGRNLQVIEDVEGETLITISEVDERNGKLWIGSVMVPFMGVYNLSS